MPSTTTATDPGLKDEPTPTRDCGTCGYCDPPPSDVTHFHRWAPRACERPVPLKEAR